MSAVEPALSAPPKPPLLRPLFTFKPVWLPGQAAVATTAVSITLFGVWALFDATSAVMALAGAMTALFARGEPYVHRARTVIGFSLLIILMSAAALWIAGSPWTLLTLLVVTSGLATAATEAMKTPVPGPALLLVPITIVVGIPSHHSELIHRITMTAIGAAVALTVTLAPWLLSRQGPEYRALLTAYRGVAETIRSVSTPSFDEARSATWDAVERAEHALALARTVPGRKPAEVNRLCALGNIAPRLLHIVELAAAYGSVFPAALLARASVLPGAVRGRPVLTEACSPRLGRAPIADDFARALDREISTVLDREARVVELMPTAGPARLCKARPLHRLHRRECIAIARVMALTLTSGSITILIGLDRWYWAPVCAVATLWGSHTWITWHRAAQRGLATVVGGFVGMAVLQPHMAFPLVAVIVTVLFFLAELSFPRNYGLAMLFVTPMVLLTIHGASPLPLDAEALSWDRIATTLVGCACGVFGVLCLLPSPSTRLLAGRIRQSLQLQQSLLLKTALTPEDHLRLCVRVRSDLVELHSLAVDALGEARSSGRARALWPVAQAASRLGYLLLALSATKPENWSQLDHAEWRHMVGDAADAVIGVLSSPFYEPQPALHREVRLIRSLIAALDAPPQSRGHTT
jgi:uncharacterized membrane protein YccC